jgi:hypothetical protein
MRVRSQSLRRKGVRSKDLHRERIKAGSMKLTNDMLTTYSQTIQEANENQKLISENLDIMIEKADILSEKTEKYIEAYQRVNKHFKVGL